MQFQNHQKISPKTAKALNTNKFYYPSKMAEKPKPQVKNGAWIYCNKCHPPRWFFSAKYAKTKEFPDQCPFCHRKDYMIPKKRVMKNE